MFAGEPAVPVDAELLGRVAGRRSSTPGAVVASDLPLDERSTAVVGVFGGDIEESSNRGGKRLPDFYTGGLIG